MEMHAIQSKQASISSVCIVAKPSLTLVFARLRLPVAQKLSNVRLGGQPTRIRPGYSFERYRLIL